MTDQTQRLEIATVNAEIGSNIVYRFTNDAADAALIPTDSGDIQNLKQVIISIQEDGTEKISFATTIYPSTVAGIAGTADGSIFLVRSADPDEIYAVYSNTAGAAVDTGKRALSASAIQAAMDSARESANAAEASANLAAERVSPFLGTFAVAPEVRNDSTALQLGDRYFNSVDDLEYLYKASGWEPNNLDGALLAAPEGSSRVGFVQVGAGAQPRDLQAKAREHLTPFDYQAVGDGVANDDASFSALEVVHQGKEVDLLGKTYLVTIYPAGNTYYGGFFKIGANTYYANRSRIRDANGVVTMGGAGGSLPATLKMGTNQFGYSDGVFAAGPGALGVATSAKQTIAVGPNALGTALVSFDNIAQGECALYNLKPVTDSYSTVDVAGTRNIARGGNAGRSLTTGRANVIDGRNTGASLEKCDEVTVSGANALSGLVVNGWYLGVENFDPNTNVATQIVVTGAGGAAAYTGIVLTATGFQVGNTLKKGNNNALYGALTGRKLESLSGLGGKVRSDYPSDPYVTYSKVGSIITVKAPGHAAVVGGRASIYWAAGGPAYANHGHSFPVDVLSVSGDTFTVFCPYVGDGSGNARLYWTTSTVNASMSQNNALFGSQVASETTTGNGGTISGAYAGKNIPSYSNITLSGFQAGMGLSVGVDSLVVMGSNALRDNLASVGAATAVGHNAGLVMQDGSVPSISVAGSTMLGSNSRVSGTNQVQLGGPGTTPYAEAPLQVRSDERDKIKKRALSKPLELIRGIEFCEFRMNSRGLYLDEVVRTRIATEDYVTDFMGADGQYLIGTREFEEEYTEFIEVPNDESRAGSRYHAGAMAQQIEKLCSDLGIDWAGLQHHAVKGGLDIYTVAYQALIPYMGACIQHVLDRQDAQDMRQDAQDKRLSCIEERLNIEQ